MHRFIEKADVSFDVGTLRYIVRQHKRVCCNVNLARVPLAPRGVWVAWMLRCVLLLFLC